MKRVKLLNALLTLIVISQFSFGQGPSFKMEGTDPEIINVNQTFKSTAEITPFKNNVNKIFGMAVSAEIMLDDESGEVKVILIDKNYREYLIYEANYLLVEKIGTPFTINEVCEETALINDVKVNSVRIEVKNASVSLKSITYTRSVRQGINFDKVRKEKKQDQNTEKIVRINKKLKEMGINWMAGPTEVSDLSYAEKKQLFGQSKFPAGFEFYSGGVISASATDEQLKSATASLYVDEWDWRNRHGKNWITPVTNQGACGSCWAFAATGAVEALANLNFNQQLNLDLSEQEILSCSGGGDCAGGFPRVALNYMTFTGIVDENTFPYTGENKLCETKGMNPSEVIKISGRYDFGYTVYPSEEDVLRKMLIQFGPLSSGLINWNHAIVLVGYQVVKEGDIFYYRGLDLSRYWKTIEAGDPLIGKTVWIFKNSWGPGFGDEGYIYVETPISNIGWTHAIKLPVVSEVKKYDVVYEDRDGDGYYWWGLGPKPANCPGPDLADGDDSDPALGPLDQYGYCTKLSGAPVADFSTDKTIINNGETVSFTDASTGNPTAWSWSFSGGTPSTSTLKNPVVTYNSAGTFNVVLTVTNSTGSDTKTMDNFIQVSVPVVNPVADFEALNTNITAGESVQFTDLSTNQPTQWQWLFPGGNPASSTSQNPKVAYNTPGEYDVTLTVSKPGSNSSVKVKTKYIITVDNTPADYCTPVSIVSSPDYIASVAISKVFSNKTVGSGYSLASGTIELVPGSYSISLTPKVTTNRNYWRLWIDFNGDKDFDDAGETLVSLNNKKGTAKAGFTIPQGATGTTRMRIAMRTSSSVMTCDDNYNGEVEDYTVSFGPAASMATAISDYLQDDNSNQLSYFPNPVYNKLNIRLNSLNSGDCYSIYNLKGEKVSSGLIINLLTTIEFTDYSQGIYLLNVINGDKVYNEKIIKQ